MNEAKKKKVEEAKASLERIQTFDVDTLGRADELGDMRWTPSSRPLLGLAKVEPAVVDSHRYHCAAARARPS